MNDFFDTNPKVLKSLLDNLHEGVVIHQSDTKIVYANRAASKIFEFSIEEMLGKKATDSAWFFIDEHHKQLLPHDYPVNKLFDSGNNIVNMILGVQKSSGDFLWLDVNATIVTNILDKKTAMIIFNDVTDQKNSYEEAALFKRVIEAVDTGVTIADPTLDDCPLIYANKAFTDTTGYSFEESVGKNCRYLRGDNHDQEGSLIAREAISKGKSCNVPLKNYTKEGKLFHNLLTLSPLMENGHVRYYIGVQHDISELKLHEKLLEDQALYIQSILNVQENIVFVSNGESILYANQSFLNFFDVPSLEIFLANCACICDHFIEDNECFHLDKNQEEKFWIEQILLVTPQERIIKLSSSTGEIFCFQVNIKLLQNQHHTITLQDITASRLKETSLSNKAYHDSLTGIFNRQYFYEYILNDDSFRIPSSSESGIMMIDLDDFKVINDTYGHAMGDDVLKKTSQTIQNSIRKGDYVIRWGGEEILVILHIQTKRQLLTTAQNIRHKIAMNSFGNLQMITASFGITLMNNSEPFDTAIARADSALYRAKKLGKNRVEIE
jgi:diguanylate cyclase (GGDEF)-like protein/PAS domain S-box-containing protein